MKNALLALAFLLLGAAPSGAQGREAIAQAEAQEVLAGHVRFADGTPLVGHPVHVERGGKIVATVRTDERGAFELPRERGRHFVVAEHAAGLRTVKDRLTVTHAVHRFDFEAREARTASLRGVALDPSGQPLPHTSFEVREPGGPSEVCVTDAGGAFASQAEFATANLTLVPMDDAGRTPLQGFKDRTYVRHLVADDGSAPPVEATLNVGYRYDLDVALLPGTSADDYVVHVRPASEAASERPGQDWGLVRGDLRAGRTPWARPAAQHASLRPTGDRALHLLARNGLAGARAELRGAAAGPLRLVLEPRGVVDVVVRPGVAPVEGEPVSPSSVKLAFTRLDGAGLPFEAHAWAGQEQTIRWVEPGRWRCDVTSPYFEPQTLEVDVLGGARRTLEVTLGRPRPVNRICIQVARADGDVSEPRAYDGTKPTASVIGGADDPATFQVGTHGWCGTGIDAIFQRVERGGRFVFEAVLENVPEDVYTVTVESSVPLVESKLAARPGDTVRFAYRAAVPELAYRFDVRAAGSSRPAAHYRVLSLLRSETPAFLERPTAGDVHAYALSASDPGAWCVASAGYRNVYGDRDAFRPDPPGFVATVELVPGFALRAHATLADGTPAAGVGLVFAGSTFTTDADGRTLLESGERAPPTRIATAPGWRIVGGDVRDGAFTREHAELRLVVERTR